MRDSGTMPDGALIAHEKSIAIRLLGVGLTAGATAILHGIDLVMQRGAPTVLMGPNGAGKTSMLRLMMGLAAPNEGSIEVSDMPDGRPARLAFVFQKPVMLKRTAAANVAFAMATAGHPATADGVSRLLRRVGLSSLADRPARRLSGGEQQRLALARALARDPDILFLDEPTASLDPAQTKAVEEIVASVTADGVKIVLSTHDIGQARRLAGEIVFLVRGRVVEQTPATEFFGQPRTEQARRFLSGELIL